MKVQAKVSGRVCVDGVEYVFRRSVPAQRIDAEAYRQVTLVGEWAASTFLPGFVGKVYLHDKGEGPLLRLYSVCRWPI